jgi:hypothetical protein
MQPAGHSRAAPAPCRGPEDASSQTAPYPCPNGIASVVARIVHLASQHRSTDVKSLASPAEQKEGTTQHSCHFRRRRRGVTSTKVSRLHFASQPVRSCPSLCIPAPTWRACLAGCGDARALQHAPQPATPSAPLRCSSVLCAVFFVLLSAAAFCILLLHESAHGYISFLV